MLVEGIRLLRVVSHRIARSHVEVGLRLVDLAGLLAKAVEAVVRLDLARMESSVIGILPVGKVRDIRMQKGTVCVKDEDPHRILLHDDLQPLSLDHRLVLPVGDRHRGELHSPPVGLQEVIGSGVPCRHGQAVGGLVKVPVESRPDPHNLIRQEQNPDLHRVGGNRCGLPVLRYLSCSVTNLHALLPACSPCFRRPGTSQCRRFDACQCRIRLRFPAALRPFLFFPS